MNRADARSSAASWVACAILICAVTVLGQDNKPPTTAPAAPTPKSIASAFAAAVEKGDVAAARGLVVKEEQDLAEATVVLAGKLKKLEAAGVSKFGDGGKSVARDRLHLLASFAALKEAAEKVEGDVATVGGNGHPGVRLKKVEGNWRVTWGLDAKQVVQQVQLYGRLGEVADRTAKEIGDGDYDDAEEAGRVFLGRVTEARIGERRVE